MKYAFILFLVLFTFNSQAEVGKILKMKRDKAYVIRNGQKHTLTLLSKIQVGDEIHSSTSEILFLIHPSTQISLSKNSQFTIAEKGIVRFLKGSGHFLVDKKSLQGDDFKVETEGVVFIVRGTEFEVSLNESAIDLNVVSGQVEASSPYVQSFVPEMVKARQGLRFDLKKKAFQRKKFSPISNDPFKFK
jgi:hypothetical protein